MQKILNNFKHKKPNRAFGFLDIKRESL